MAMVVVVEDEPALRDILTEVIGALGHEVVTASNGKAGLEAIVRHSPDFVCCDINMPVMNGLEMKQKLNQLGMGHIRFIFITARAHRNDVADGLMIGADHYLTKPIDMKRLAALLA